MENIQKYWRIIVAGLCVAFGTFIIMLSNNETSDIESRANELRKEIQTLEIEINRKDLTAEDLQPEVEIIKTSGAHARDMGAEMAEAQIILASYYKNPEPISEDEDMTKLEKAQSVFTRLTESTDYPNTWVLNDTWTISLDTVATYSDVKKIPVVFSMNMANGDLAGIVRGRYDSERDLLSDIVINYTVNGYADVVDPGGA